MSSNRPPPSIVGAGAGRDELALEVLAGDFEGAGSRAVALRRIADTSHHEQDHGVPALARMNTYRETGRLSEAVQEAQVCSGERQRFDLTAPLVAGAPGMPARP